MNIEMFAYWILTHAAEWLAVQDEEIRERTKTTLHTSIFAWVGLRRVGENYQEYRKVTIRAIWCFDNDYLPGVGDSFSFALLKWWQNVPTLSVIVLPLSS